MFQIILEGRKRREVDPTLSVLRECVEESRAQDEIDPTAKRRLLELLGFFEMTTGWFEQVRHMPRTTLTRFVKMGDKVSRLLSSSGRD